MTLSEIIAMREKDLVIRFRQPLDMEDGVFHSPAVNVPAALTGSIRAPFLRRKAGWQFLEDRFGRIMEMPHFLSLAWKSSRSKSRSRRSRACR